MRSVRPRRASERIPAEQYPATRALFGWPSNASGKRSRGWQRLLFIVASIAAVISAGAASHLAESAHPPTLISEALGQASSVAPNPAPRSPAILADSAVVMNRRTGEVLFAKFPDTRRAIASTTKLMTGLIAAESGRLDTIFTVSQNAATVGETTMGAVAGERLSLRELMYGLMLPSGNDAAVAIAEALSGSVPAFADAMNRRAHDLGMWNSQFANPHGLDHERFYRPDHFSTARDMAILGSAVGDNPGIRQIAGTTIHEVPGSDGRPARLLRNTLGALWWYPGVLAGKTGWTERAGQCRVVVAERAGIQISVALLGSPDDTRELRDLLDYGFALAQARQPRDIPLVVPSAPALLAQPDQSLVNSWEQFWFDFVTPDGRVKSGPNGQEASSSLQAAAMTQAVWFQDREAFDKVWAWTRKVLWRSNPGSSSRPRDGLFATSWSGGAVTNWASDVGSDQRIAGALLMASRLWRDKEYADDASTILNSVLEKSAISSGRLGVAFQPSSPSSQTLVTTNASALTPAFHRMFAEGTRQGVWHWLIDGSYEVLRRALQVNQPTRPATRPLGLVPSVFSVARQGLAVTVPNRDGEALGKLNRLDAELVAQLAMEVLWRRQAGVSVDVGTDRDRRPGAILDEIVRTSVPFIAEMERLAPGDQPIEVLALIASMSVSDPAIGARMEQPIVRAMSSSEASTRLSALVGRWFLNGGPPDVWRYYPSPPNLPTSRNDQVEPPKVDEPWFYAEETGHSVSGAFAAFVASVGGLETTGDPRTDALMEQGRRVQYFERCVVEELEGPTGKVIVPRKIGPVLSSISGLADRVEFNAVDSVAVVVGRKTIAGSGHTMGGAFLKVYDALAGVRTVLGRPISEDLIEAGVTVQYFEGGRLEFTPGQPGLAGQPVRLSNSGSAIVAANGW